MPALLEQAQALRADIAAGSRNSTRAADISKLQGLGSPPNFPKYCLCMIVLLVLWIAKLRVAPSKDFEYLKCVSSKCDVTIFGLKASLLGMLLSMISPSTKSAGGAERLLITSKCHKSL
eukprot:3928362-Amphidinium_carterae.1